MATPIPQNEAAFSLAEIVAATGGVVVEQARSAGEGEGSVGAGDAGDAGEGARGEGSAVAASGDEVRVVGVSTDTRAITAGALFVALRGESFDAHDHVGAAVAGGARVVVVEREVSAGAGAVVVRVGSTLAALAALGRAHARRWRGLGGIRKVIAITGSAGKTTTRVATQALLERLHPGEVHATRGNLNNLVGAPMVLLGLLPAHRYAVVEVGTNRPGEIEALARLVEADVGVVTLVAAAHVEELGSVEGVAHEKGALLRALGASGVAIGNGDNSWVRAQLGASPAAVKATYGTGAESDVRIAARAPVGMTASRIAIEVAGRRLAITTPLIGEAGALACAAAIAIAERGLGEVVTESAANEAFARAEVGGGAGRLVAMKVGEVVVIDDSYNANPASMRASIAAAAEIAAAEKRRLVLVLGEMRELGSAAESSHDEVGQAARASGAALVIAVGPLAARFTLQLLGSPITHVHVDRAADAAVFATQWTAPGDLVLVKGSRGIGTDAVVRALREHFGSAASHDAGVGGRA